MYTNILNTQIYKLNDNIVKIKQRKWIIRRFRRTY